MNHTSLTRAYWIHALTPLHAGAGRGAGFIDLPIAREEVTGWPLIPGTAVKGVLSDTHNADPETGRKTEENATDDRKKAARLRALAFGLADDDNDRTGSNSNAGALVFTDARLICLPVKSLYGTFAWCTCPMVLARIQRDLIATGNTSLPQPSQIPLPKENTPAPVLVPDKPGTVLADGKNVFFEDLDFRATPNDEATRWAEAIAGFVFEDAAWQQLFVERFAILPDDFFDFLCETATQVDARVRINPDTKTVQNGALWYEESLPAESILAGLAWCDRVYDRNTDITQQQLMQEFCSAPLDNLQIGGKASVGRGRVRLSFGELHERALVNGSKP